MTAADVTWYAGLTSMRGYGVSPVYSAHQQAFVAAMERLPGVASFLKDPKRNPENFFKK